MTDELDEALRSNLAKCTQCGAVGDGEKVGIMVKICCQEHRRPLCEDCANRGWERLRASAREITTAVQCPAGAAREKEPKT